MSDVELHRRAKDLFLRLIALPADTRGSLLDQESADDAGLRAEVESLLRYAGADETLGATAATVGDQSRSRFAAGHMLADRYRIIAELGRGASGEVYRALDTRLDVEIALKIVWHRSPQAIRRLAEEVRLARTITHPAICRVYDVEEGDGEHFLTMELVAGDSLAALLARAGRLSGAKVRQIGVELLSGLAAAHAHGILHRDLKPSNVMIDGSGSVRITDFGIAAFEDAVGTAPFAGTPDFMAPEQLERGAPASVKTDLYAIGLILYEALVGHLPDGGDSGERTRPVAPSRIVPDCDAALDDVLLRLLARDPGERWSSAAEAAGALEAGFDPQVGRGRPRSLHVLALAALVLVVFAGYFTLRRLDWNGRRPVRQEITDATGRVWKNDAIGIAVLPLADDTEAKDQSGLAQEVQRNVITSLEALRSVRVIAESSTDRYGPKPNVQEAGRELGVRFVAAGRVLGAAEDQQIELTVYDVGSGKPVWSSRYPRDAIASAPAELERSVLGGVGEPATVNDAPATRASAVDETDPGTYALYLRGREHVPPYTETEFASSVALLKQVVAKRPEWPDPYAAVATAYVAACAIGWVEPADGYPIARRYAERAITLDPSLCEAHVALAIVAGEYDWDWAAAEASYGRAFELCPGSAWMHRSRARFLATQGRFDEAIKSTVEAIQLDPTSAVMLQGAAQRFYDARRYDRSVALARIAKTLDPVYPYTYFTLAYALMEQGRFRDALDALDTPRSMPGLRAAGEALRAYVFARSQDQRSAVLTAAETRRLGPLGPAERALLALAENDADSAVAALADAVARRAPPSIWLAVSPVYDPLRDRDDFKALVARVGVARPVEAR